MGMTLQKKNKSMYNNSYFYISQKVTLILVHAHDILQPMLRQPFDYKNKLLLMVNLFPFQRIMLTFSLIRIHFFLFSDTCMVGFNGSTKFQESMLSLIPKQRAILTFVLNCYVQIYNRHLTNYGPKKVQKSSTTIHRQLFMGGLPIF